MKIAVDVRSIMYGKYTGIGEYTYQLLDHLVHHEDGHRYFLFCNSQKPTALPNWQSSNVSQTVFHYPNKLLHGSMLAFHTPNVERMLEKRVGESMDTVFMPNQNFITLRPQTKLIITVHDLSFVRFPQFFTPFHRFWHRAVNLRGLAERAHRVIAVSQHTANDLQALWNIDRKKIRVIHPGLDPMFHQNDTTHTKTLDLPDEYLLFLGTLEPRKNIEFILDLFDQTAPKHPNLHLVLAGGWGWETEGIKRRLAQSPFLARIKILGYVPREQKPELYRRAKVFLFPSFYEGFGFPPLEAMSQDCPVMTSSYASLPEVVEDGAVCLSVTDQTPWLLCLDELLSNRPAFEGMVNRGRELASRYQWSQAAAKTAAVFSE